MVKINPVKMRKDYTNLLKDEFIAPPKDTSKREMYFPITLKAILKVLAMKQTISVYYCDRKYDEETDSVSEIFTELFHGRAMKFDTEGYGYLKVYKLKVVEDYIEIYTDNVTDSDKF